MFGAYVMHQLQNQQWLLDLQTKGKNIFLRLCIYFRLTDSALKTICGQFEGNNLNSNDSLLPRILSHLNQH